MSSYVNPDFQVAIADYPYDPRLQVGPKGPRVVRQQTRGGTRLYYVYIHLEGPDLPLVRGVKYSLHPTVKPPEPYVERNESNPDCMLPLWLWGTFEMRATVFDIRGRTFPLSHYLQFDSYFDSKKFYEIGLVIRDEGETQAS